MSPTSESYKPLESTVALSVSSESLDSIQQLAVPPVTVYILYPARFYGLFAIVLFNITTALNWLLFSAVAQEAATRYSCSLTAINWLSTVVCALYLVLFAVVPYVATRYSCRMACIIAATFMLIGAWIRYASSVRGSFGLLMFGTLLAGSAQPFVQIIASLYSEQWFSPTGRTVATTVIAVANPFGGALASVLGPLIVTRGASDIPKLLLVAAIISTVAAPTCLLVQAKPPTPPSPAASIDGRESLWAAVHTLARFESRAAKDFAVVFVCFSAAMSAFDATTTLLSQIFGPEGYSDDASGFFGAAMILAGLLAAGIVAPVLDRTALGRRLALLAKILIPIVAISYVGLIFATKPNNYAGLYILMITIGVCSFVLLFVALELSADLAFDLGVLPDSLAALLYLGGNGLSVVFILAMDALRDSGNSSMKRALVFQALCVAVPCLSVAFLSNRQARKEMEDHALNAKHEGRLAL